MSHILSSNFYKAFACSLLLIMCGTNFSAMAEESISKPFTLRSDILKDDYSISVSLPTSYNQHKKSYPVIYTLDADFLFDPIKVIMATRASRDLMPEFITVGIKTASSAQRFVGAMPIRPQVNGPVNFDNGNPEAFLSFIKDELMPHIEQSYRTSAFNVLVGMSPTAGMVIHSYISDDDTFQGHIAIAADIHSYTRDNLLIADVLAAKARTKGSRRHWLYISRGEQDIIRNSTLKQTFEGAIKSFKDLSSFSKIEIIQNGEHYASAIESINNAFGFMFPATIWAPNYLAIRTNDDPVMPLMKHYSDLTKSYGFPIYPTINGYWMGLSLGGTVRYLTRQKRFQEAIDLIIWAQGRIPEDNYLNDLYNWMQDELKKQKSDR